MEEIINRVIEFLFLKNSIVAIPVFSTILVILFKTVSYRGEFDSDSIKAMLNIGLDLATAGIFVLLTNISFSVTSSISSQIDEISDLVYRNLFLHGMKILLYLVLVLVFSLGIRIFTWDKESILPKNTWRIIIIVDAIGMLLLILSIQFTGGNVK